MKFKKRILTSILAISLTASVGIPVSGLVMAQDTVNDDNSKTENEIVFTADGGNEVISINKPEEGEKEEEKPGEQEDPEKPYHEDDYGYDLELDSKFVTLERDYAQKLTVKVKNNTKKPMNYYLKAENPNDDIYLNFVQEGSEDAPLTIEPGAEKEIELSIFLQNASQKEYSIPVVAMASNGDSGAEFEQVSRHTVDFKCNHGNVSYSLVAGEIDEETLTQTYYVRNNGDDVSDLTISVGEDVSRYLSVSPLIENYYLEEGGEVSFTVKPDFFNMDEDDMATVTGAIIATGGAAKQELAATFKLPDNYNTIEAWRLALYQDDNPYYMIEEECELEDKVSENLSELGNNPDESELYEAIGLNTDSYDLNNLTTTATFEYQDEGNNNQNITLETEITTFDDVGEEQDDVIVDCREEKNSYVIETSIVMSPEEFNTSLIDYIENVEEKYKDNSNIREKLSVIKNDINNNNEKTNPKRITFSTTISDSKKKIRKKEADDALSAFVKANKSANKKGYEYAIDAFGAIPKIGDARYIYDGILTAFNVKTLTDPNASEHKKNAARGGICLTLLGVIIDFHKKSPISKALNPLSLSWGPGLEIINKLYNIVNNMREGLYSEDSLYYMAKQYGEQCTNAGSVTNNIKMGFGNGIKIDDESNDSALVTQTNSMVSPKNYNNSNSSSSESFEPMPSSSFITSATKYDHDMALYCAKLSDAAYDNKGTGLDKFKFDLVKHCNNDEKDGGGTFYLAHKHIEIDGKETTVLVIDCRGTQTTLEKLGDWLRVPSFPYYGDIVKENVKSFSEKVLSAVDDYINTHVRIKNAKNLKIIVTGHSLGGAAANLIGAVINKNVGKDKWWSDKVTKNDIYVYTFGAINVVYNGIALQDMQIAILKEKSNISKGFENIHNIYNEKDSFNSSSTLVSSLIGVSSPYAKYGHTDLIYFRENNDLLIDSSWENHAMYNYVQAVTLNKEKLQNNSNHQNKKMSGKKVKSIQVEKDSYRLAETDSDQVVEKKDTDSSISYVYGNHRYVVTTGRVSGIEGDYTDTEVTAQEFIVNGESLGSRSTDGLTELFIVSMLTDSFKMNDSNTIKRVFNTNPGSHTIATDTEYNIYIPDKTKIAYVGSLDSLDDIRALPDFAIYPENISADKDAYVGDNNPVSIKIYNRGSSGGWTDVDVTVDGQNVYHEDNVYIGAFSYDTVEFDFTPTNDSHNVSVTLTNKTVDVDERTGENNKAEKTLNFKRYEVPEITEITPETLTLADTDEGAFVKCQINKDSTVQKVVFKVDNEVLAENEYVSGTGESSAFVPAEKLTKGIHKLTAEVTYKENKTSEAVITKTENLEVKVRDTIDFEIKTNNYPYFRLLRLGNEYEEDEYYEGVNSGEKRYYDEDSYELKRTEDEDNGVYKCSLYPTSDDVDLNNGKYYLLCDYDNGLELIPVSELKGKTLSIEGAKKITVERTEDFSDVCIRNAEKINGIPLYYGYDIDNYNEEILIGDGIDSIELSTSFYVSGAYDSQKDELDMTKGDGVILLKDNTKTITLSNCSGDTENERLLAYSGEGYDEMYFSSNHNDNNYSLVFSADKNKQLQQSDKAILYFRDDEAIYEMDLKTLSEDKADLAELRNDYNSINYVYDPESIQIISRTIKRKLPENVWSNVSYSIDKDSIKTATGEYTVTTKYRSNGTVLEDVQDIVVSGTDVDIILPVAAENITTVSVEYPDYYTSVYLEWYDDNWSWHHERIEESGDKVVVDPGEHEYTISASTYDDMSVSLKRSVDVAEHTNTEIKIGENFAANVHISNIDSNNTNIFETKKGSDVEFYLSNFKDEYGSELYNYDDYNWYSDNNTEAKLILTSVTDTNKKYEIGYNSNVSYISEYGKNLTFKLPEEIEGDYNYKIMMTRVVPDPPISLEEIKLDKNELTMEPDSEDELTVTYVPEDTTWSKAVWWESSDDEIVTVEDGKLKALKEGTATITVRSDEDYWISDSCEVTVKHTHDMQTVLAKDPKCTEDGNIEYYICSKCEKWYEDKEGAKEITDKASVVIPMTGHDHEESVTKEAGCVEIGIKTFTCKNDPTHNYTEDIPATGHEWNDWQVIKEATEFEEGTRTRTCKRDASHIETEVIPKLEHVHNMIFVKAVEPTCDTTGIKAHYVCTGCQLLFEDEQGDMKIEDKNSVVLTAIGHEWGDWTVSKEPSCTEKGSEVRICKNDSNHREEQEIPPKGHSLIKTESKAPTCEKDGNIEYYTCSECGEIYKDSEGTQVIKETEIIIPAIGHNWSDWTMSLPATCTSSGEEIRTCNNGAPHSETRNTEPLGHAWGEWKVTKEATENENGERTRVCANDLNHIDIEIIPETGSQNEDSGSEEQKPEEQKPEEQKPEEQKPEEQKPEEQKPEEQKPEEQKRVDIDNKDNDSEKEITNSKVKTITNADEPVMSDDTSVEKYSREDNKVIEYKAEAVHTGDKNNLGWIIALSLSAVGIMAALIVFLNNRKKHKG